MRLEKRKSGLSVLRNVVGSVLVVTALVAGGGFIAGWWDGPQPEHSAVLAKQTESFTTQPAPKAAESPMAVSIQSLSTPVPQESNASITVKTLPNADCTIKATYAGVASTDQGLAPEAADDSGIADWTWTVEASAPLGTWPVEVTCTHNGQSATARGNIVVSIPPAH